MSVIFDSLTLVDSSASETYHVSLWSPAKSNIVNVSFPFARGRMVKTIAKADSPETSRRWNFSDGAGRECVLRKASVAAYETFLALVAAKVDTVGTLQIEAQSFTNVHFLGFDVSTVLKTGTGLYLVRFTAAFAEVES